MTQFRRLPLLLAGVAITASLALAGAIAPSAAVAAVPPVAGGVPTFETTSAAAKITMRDGVQLAAQVYSPKGATGTRPLVLLPSAWGGESGQMFWSGGKLASRGFVVINYATRGFKDSGGEVDMASLNDMHDVSDLIDWAVKNQPVDGTRVGMFGLSYGAGLSLLASAYEPRLDAVGSLEGFADLPRTVYPNGTRSTFLSAFLWYGAVIAGKISPQTTDVFTGAVTGKPGMDKILPYLAERSPINLIDRINKNNPAIMLATSWNDLAYGTDQIFDFYNRLTVTNKRLELRPGDHVINEVPTSIGLGNPDLYNHLFDWMTTYVGGIDTPLAHQAPVWMQPRSSGPQPKPQTYPSLPSMTTGTATYGLTKPTGLIQPTGTLATSAAGDWSTTIEKGWNFGQGIQAPVLSFIGEAVTGQPPYVLAGLANRANVSVFKGAKLSAPLVLRGQSTVKLNITPTKSEGTVVVYLYDMKGDADGYLISHRPYSWHGATPGKTIQVTLPLQPTAYTLPKGNALGLGVSSGDPAYADSNPDGAKIALGSTTAFPASVTVSTGIASS